MPYGKLNFFAARRAIHAQFTNNFYSIFVLFSPAKYNPASVEDKWYSYWIENKFFPVIGRVERGSKQF